MQSSQNKPYEWKKNVLVPIDKNKSDIQCCNNYHGFKLMNYTMKLWEKVIEQRLICEISVLYIS